MYFKFLLLILFILYSFCGCGQLPEQNQDYYLQELAHLHLEDAVQNLPEDSEIRAVWIPVMIYENWMENKSETQFRESVRNAFQNCTDLGLNTVFVHVRAYGDAYYQSELFPKGTYLTGDYDPLGIMLEEGHQLGLRIHAWINPLRAQSVQKMASLEETYLLRQWYDTRNGTYLVSHDGRYYLNPAYPEIRQLIADGIAEIIRNYD
ncbi:MAG: family 10 glycosylhydrolase, partial [Oscillospiraceae bacterium]|nr:family 10 glycosylhydrolase [Oscillospiraceae bacterium]